MKHVARLFFSVFIFCANALYAQTNDTTFSYKQDSIIELLNDTGWIKNSTEKYLILLKDKFEHKQIDASSFLRRKLVSYILLDQYRNGLIITDSILGTHFDYFFDKSYFTILYGYFTQCAQQNKQAYIPAVRAAFKKANASDFDWFLMNESMRPNGHYGAGTIIGYATNDASVLVRYFKARIKNFKSGGGSFSFADMGNVLRMVAFIKISHTIADENNKLITEISSPEAYAKKDIPKEIDQSLASIFPDNEPGAAVVLMKDEKILLQRGYGIADINTKEKIDVHTNFNIGSISKMFTATAIMLLKQENKLSLQDLIIKYLPDVNPKIGSKITIYHLLTHSSGLPQYIPSKDSVKALTAMDRDTYNDDKNIDSLLFEPGTKFSYSNIGYRWLSMIVENVSGMKFGDFVRQNILLPANMKNSYELNREMPIPNFAHAYKNIDNKFTEYDYGEEPQFSTLGDGGVVSNISDFVEWEKALRTHRILSKLNFDESIKPQIISDEDPPGTYYGYGWFVETNPEHKTAYSHSGGNGAFISYFLRIPEENIMFVMFMNRDDVMNIYQYVQELLKNAKWY